MLKRFGLFGDLKAANEDEPQAAAADGDADDGAPQGPSRASLNKARKRLRATLTPAQPVRFRNSFAGRAALIERVMTAIDQKRLHVVLYGARGMGKTSILNVLQERCRLDKWLVIYASCGGQTTFSSLLTQVLSQVPLRYHRDFRGKEAPEEGMTTMAHLLQGRDPSVSDATALLGAVTGTRVLVCVDEFERTTGNALSGEVADLIKALSDLSAPAQLVIGGVASDVAGLVAHLPSVQRNIAGFKIPPLHNREVAELLSLVEVRTGLTFEAPAVARAAAIGAGWPYVVSLIANEAASIALSRESLIVTEKDMQQATLLSLEDIKGRISVQLYRELRFSAEKAGRDMLEAAAKAHLFAAGLFSEEDLRRVGGESFPVEQAMRAFEALAKEDLVFTMTGDRFGQSFAFRDMSFPLMLVLERAAAME